MKIALITNMNRAKGNEVMIRSFCTAVSTSISGLASPKSKSAIVANSIKTDQTSRCFLFGSFFTRLYVGLPGFGNCCFVAELHCFS